MYVPKMPSLKTIVRSVKGMPVHPATKTGLIPVIITRPDGITQTYWVSLKRFMEERNKGTPIQRIPRKEHKDITVPEQVAPIWMQEFIENIEDFNVAGLTVKNDKYEVELVAEVRVKKNGKLIKTYPVKVNREKIARAILKKLMV